MEYKEYREAFDQKKDMARLFAYYRGKHNILKKQYKPTMPKNRLVNAFASYITNVNVGYFLGTPVRYTSLDETFMEVLKDIFDYNDEQDENLVLARFASIGGTAYEIVYIDEASRVRFNEVSPEHLVLIYDKKIMPSPEYAVRMWADGTDEYLEAYTQDEVITYKNAKEISRYAHHFGDVPVIEYPNNDDRQGDFEKVITLIDAYDNAQSNIANDFEYFSDAYLVLKNLSGTREEDIQKMRQDRALLIDNDGDAKWLLKDVQDSAHENFKNRLQQDIHRFSQTPNLTDESFAGNSSGVALRYKLLGLEWNAAIKERKFKRGLQRRLELICNMLNLKGGNYDWREVSIQFSRNLPQNELEAVQIIGMLKGIISDQTLLGMIPGVDDPNEELDRIEKERGYSLDDAEPTSEL